MRNEPNRCQQCELEREGNCFTYSSSVRSDMETEPGRPGTESIRFDHFLVRKIFFSFFSVASTFSCSNFHGFANLGALLGACLSHKCYPLCLQNFAVSGVLRGTLIKLTDFLCLVHEQQHAWLDMVEVTYDLLYSVPNRKPARDSYSGTHYTQQLCSYSAGRRLGGGSRCNFYEEVQKPLISQCHFLKVIRL